MLVWSHCAHTGPSITFLLRQVQDHPGRMPPHHEVNKEPSVRVWRGTGEGEPQPQSSSRPRLLLTGKHFLLDKKKGTSGLLGGKGQAMKAMLSLCRHKQGHQKPKPVTFMLQKSKGVYFPLCPKLPSLKKRQS